MIDHMLLMTRCAGCDAPGAPVCTTCRFALVGRTPRPQPHGVHAAVPFTGRARDVVLGLKYRNRRRVGRHLAGLVVNQIVERGDHRRIDVVTWAPTSAGSPPRARLRPGRSVGPPHRRPARRARAPAARSHVVGRPADRPDPSGATRQLAVPGPTRRPRHVGAGGRRRRHHGRHHDACCARPCGGGRGRGVAVRRGVDTGRGRSARARRRSHDRRDTTAAAADHRREVPGDRLDRCMGILDRILRAGEGKKVKALEGIVPDVNALGPEFEALSDDALKAKTPEFRQRLDNGADLDDLLIEAFAVTREAATRVIGQRHYDVQLVGGAALHFGWVAEAKTGEGKTLVSTLPAYLNGVGGKGVHLVTVNDYLARRDAEWMGQIHRWLGLDVGLIIPGYRNSPAEKRKSYECDITYGTNNEMGFDYLRDNMAQTKADKVQQRGHNYCIVDEVDSILIDEARTPLIISGRVADAAKLYYRFASIVRGLAARRRLRGRRGQARRDPARGGHREGRGCARCREPLRQRPVQPRAPVHRGVEGQGAVQARQGLHRPGRRGEDRRRVHRSHPRRSALVRGHPPGGRGEGGREDQGGEPDPRHDHPPELLPHVRQARRHDRHGPDRGRRADEHLRARCGADPDEPCRCCGSTRPT